MNADGGPVYHVPVTHNITSKHPRAGRRQCPLLSYITKKKATLAHKLKTGEGESHAPRRHSRPLITHHFGHLPNPTEISKQKIVVATGDPSPQLRAVSRKQQQESTWPYNATIQDSYRYIFLETTNITIGIMKFLINHCAIYSNVETERKKETPSIENMDRSCRKLR